MGWKFVTDDGFIEAGPDDISILDWTNMDDSKLFCFTLERPFFLMMLSNLATQAPTRLKVKIGNSIRDFQGGKGGMYLLQAGLVNHFNHWISADEERSIWWSNGCWVVGNAKDSGSGSCGIHSPQDDEWPHEIKGGWMYSNNGFKEANPNEIVFQDFSQVEGNSG